MAKKINIPADNNILKVPIEEAMPDNYLPYAVEVAKDRALPDVRDGLKPVHRRILYGAYMLKAFPDRPYLKSARIVGDILGKYHPHGDTSVYDAMVLFAQNFSTRMPLIDGHGNWGSQDGDSAAAMRYTEARLASLSLEMLKDIDKGVVNMVNNYSDSEKEPEVLPGRYPNLLVNGTFGIAVGLATNIPPHNLSEVIDGVLALADNEEITTKELMEHIKGPDLPTGGILIGEKSIENAYKSGRGKVTLRAKTKIEKLENGRLGIVISEFPFRKNKSKILQTISEMTGDKRHSKVLEPITDIRDESDRNGIRAVIEFKKSAQRDTVEKVLKYIFKKTELQSNLSFNMVALVNGKPETMGLKTILYHYLEHQKEVVTRRTKKELEIAEKRFHIVEGFIKAISILDEVIKTIRASKSKKDAQVNLVSKFDFTEIQAEAILELMLYRLTGLEITTFEKEHKQLEKLIAKLKKILSSDKELLKVIKKEIIAIKEKYADKRRTEIIYDESKADINEEELIVVEDIMITMSNEGFIKRTGLKSYNRSSGNVDDIEYRESDYNKYLISSNTKDILMLFTDKGNMYQVRGIDIPETRWKEKGERIDLLIKGLDLSKERIVRLFSIDNIAAQKYLLFFTDRGGINKIQLNKFNNTYSKLSAIKLKDEENVIEVMLLENDREERFISINTAKGMHFTVEEPRVDSCERNSRPTKLININSIDEVISTELSDDYEYKTFPVAINMTGIIKTEWGRNRCLRTYTDSASTINIFTNNGKIYNIPAFMIQNIHEGGMHIYDIVEGYDKKDKVISINSCASINDDISVYTMTRKGIIRRTKLGEFLGKNIEAVQCKLKDEDLLAAVDYRKDNEEKDILLVTQKGMCIRFDSDNVNTMKKNAVGVTGISLKEDDKVIFGVVVDKESSEDETEIKLIVNTKSGKRKVFYLNELQVQNRAGRGRNIIQIDIDDYVKEVKLQK